MELRDPETGHTALVVGTAHVSAKAAEEVKRLLEETQPEMCAVELDRHRLKQALLRLRHLEARGWEDTEHQYKVPTTAWKALRMMYGAQGGPARLFYVLSDSVSSSILGTPYGVDMLTAISTCERLGIKLVPIDRPAGITFARMMAQGEQMGALQKRMEREQEKILGPIARDPEDVAPKGAKAKRAAAMRRMRDFARRAAEAAGCPDPEGAVAALVSTVHLAMEDKEVPPEDLREIRSCGTRIIEFVRQAALAGPAQGSSDKAAPAGAPGAGPAKDDFQRAIQGMVNGEGPPALSSERDLILAQNLRLCTQKGATVAVVGAGHVPGIKARWETALDPASILEAKGYLTLPNRPYARGIPPSTGGISEVSGDSAIPGGEGGGPVLEGFRTEEAQGGRALHGYAPTIPGASQRRIPIAPILVGASFIGLSVYRPRTAAVLGLTVGSVAAAGNYMIASTISRAGRAAARLEEASRKLSADGVEGDQFLF